MIVKCDQCQTRFKIPDEKVTEKGVKVRCTKCQNTFRVTKGAGPEAQSGAPAPTPAPAPKTASKPVAAKPFDPFEAFGPPPGESTRDFVAPPEIAAKAGRPTNETSAALDELFDAPTRVGSLPIPEDARPPAIDFSAPTPARGTPLRGTPVRGTPLKSPPKTKPVALRSPPPPPPPAAASRGLELDLPPLNGGPPEAQPMNVLDGGASAGSNAFLGDLSGPPSSAMSSFPSGLDESGLFGDPGSTLGGMSGVHEAPQLPDRGLFDIPPPPEPSPTAAPEPVPVAIGAIKLARQADSAREAEPRPPPTTARRATGVAANLAVAAVLLMILATFGTVYVNDGKLDAASFSLEGIRLLLFPPRAMVAVDVSNGLFETQRGRPVFYVRGEIENRSSRAARVKVRAEILDGIQLVRAAEAYAGPVPSAEELFSIGAASDVDAVTQRLDRGAAALAPGGRAPFVLVFYEYPPDLSAYRLHVSAREDGPQTATR